jgi:Ca2+-binding EF-hand superfamily protein
MKTLIPATLAPAALLLAGLASAADPRPAAPKAPADVQEFVFLGEARPVLVRLSVRMNGKPLQAAHDDCLKYLFDYLDVNGDGVLTKDEVERAPSAPQLLGGALGGAAVGGGRGRGGPAPGPTMADFDADGDGKVTLAEFTAYYRKHGVVPFQFELDAPGPNPIAAATAFLGGPGAEPSVDAVSKAIFELLDTNRDGKLTKDKLAAAEALLLKLDEDEDELVSTHELVPDTGPNITQLAGMLAMGRGDRAKATSTPTLVPVLVPGEVPADLVKRMHERYGKGDAEKKLSRKDLGLDEATFKQLDADGDGVLDALELAGFVKREPDLELVLRLGKKESSEARVEVVTGEGRSPLAAQVRTVDGAALLDLGRTLADLRANDEDRPDRLNGIVRQQYLVQFRAADTNNDGFVDAEEAKNSRQFRTLFKYADRKGTGKVSEQDLNAYLDHLQELQKRVSAGCVTLDISDQSRGLFDLLDTNRDGRLSVREMRQAPKLLARLDREGKGFITRDDIPRSYRLEVRRGPAGQGLLNGAAAFFDRYAATSAPVETEQAGRGPLWFRKMDRNRDGDVSRREFLFGDELFRKIDTDGDGLISLEEAERYDAMMRKKK